MRCEACGGDGLIEHGAYRGADDTDTRQCRLCGGPRPVFNIPAGTSIDSAVEALKKLGQAGLELATPPSAKAILGTAATAEKIVREVHAGQAAQYEGETFLNTGPQSWNPADVAREYAQRLHAENERRQREAEQDVKREFYDPSRDWGRD